MSSFSFLSAGSAVSSYQSHAQTLSARQFGAHSKCRHHGTASKWYRSALIDLDAKSAIESIRQAFNRDIVSLGVAGDFEDFEIEMGLREKRETGMPFNSVRALRKAKDSETKVTVKIGRNELCLCGSGKKYKKCCIK